ASLAEYGRLTKPRIVIWQYFEGNDLWDLTNEKKYAALRRYLDPFFSQGLAQIQPDIDGRLKAFVNQQPEYQRINDAATTSSAFVVISRSRNTRALISGAFMRFRPTRANGQPAKPVAPSPSADPKEVPAEFSTIVAMAKALAASWGGRLYFVYLPSGKSFSP